MEAQARKLFRLGRTIKILLIIVVAAVGISTLLTFWDALSCTLRPADEVVYVAEAVELRAREKALMGWGSVVYSVCTIIAFAFCIGMTQKMAADRNPFNVENVRLLRRMALLFGLTAAAVQRSLRCLVGFRRRADDLRLSGPGCAPSRRGPAAPLSGGRVRLRLGAPAALR